jgi:aspartate dehydrogenase
MKKRIGLIGFGFIGRYLLAKAEDDDLMEIDFVYDVDSQRTAELKPSSVLKDVSQLQQRHVDLVVEAAHPLAVRELGPQVLGQADLLIFSLTSLADDAFRKQMAERAEAANRCVYIPHGVVLGLDGLQDGREVINAVSITTVKHPRNLGLEHKAAREPVTIYEGSTRGACNKFPRNVNVHAAVALAGIGFDRTISKIVADPLTDRMAHTIQVSGTGLQWEVNMESDATGAVTGSYTPESAYQTVKRLCRHNAGFKIA